MNPLFPVVPEDFGALSDEELQAFVDDSVKAAEDIGAAPESFVVEGESPEASRTFAQLYAEMDEGVAALEQARAELATRQGEVVEEPAELEVEPEAIAAEPTPESFADLATRARAEAEEPEAPEGEEEPETPAEPEEPEATAVEKPVVASAAAPRRTRRALPAPSRSRASAPVETTEQASLVAAAGGLGPDLGASIDGDGVADMMAKRREQFGIIPPGTTGEKIPIARLDWRDSYGEERTLRGGDVFANMGLIAAATDEQAIRVEFERRRKGALVASGGLCAPVTPYYNLQMLSVADRPVRAALPGFNADRGGMRFARPASLAAINTAVGIRTAAEDFAGGTEAVKTCQVVDCPDFEEADVDIIFHCLQFGNLGARTFPERVMQWNNLTLAAHARLAETNLLDGIDAASTHVIGGCLGCDEAACDSGGFLKNLGASSQVFSQIAVAANGMRNRHRMNSEAVLRLLLPYWSVDLIISDVIRSQFQRFDTDAARVVALFRQFNVEPTFYIDGATGQGQVFGAQSDNSALLPFPETMVSYLYPEGSFIFLDGGVLELGLVRDSVLNRTNDFQIFGETFEQVAFVGVESLAISHCVADTGAVSKPTTVGLPIDYSDPRVGR